MKEVSFLGLDVSLVARALSARARRRRQKVIMIQRQPGRLTHDERKVVERKIGLLRQRLASVPPPSVASHDPVVSSWRRRLERRINEARWSPRSVLCA